MKMGRDRGRDAWLDDVDRSLLQTCLARTIQNTITQQNNITLQHKQQTSFNTQYLGIYSPDLVMAMTMTMMIMICLTVTIAVVAASGMIRSKVLAQ